MPNKEQPHEVVDFEFRRVARRRIMEVLDAHQKSEAETVEQTVKSILEFYTISLKVLGEWVADSYESKNVPYSLHCRPAFITWSSLADRRRIVLTQLRESEAALQKAASDVMRIEPNFIKQLFSDKPGMSKAKEDKSRAQESVTLTMAHLMNLTIQLEAETRDLLNNLAADIEELPKDIALNPEIEMAIGNHVLKATTLWNSHREREISGLREITELVHILAVVPGERNEN